MPLSTTLFRHRPEITRTAEETVEGAAWIYRSTCSCGHAGPDRFREHEADRAAHLEQIAPPSDQRCRDQHGHGTQPWDVCVLCAGQNALF
ncbi:hypothetical protein ACQEU5_25255 [Marinactinospora thermotolerans]|uniref:hypothetical protein n=1 Tax=Marinactinospora thermotolerans TaxID=531310 RepID=UPI003D8D895F